MTIRYRVSRPFLLVAAWAMIFPADAWAYLDPGTGSLIVQSLIALLAAIGYGLRLYWSRIRLWFKGSTDDSHPQRNPPPAGSS